MKYQNKKIYINETYIGKLEKSLVLKTIQKNQISTYGSSVALFEKKISKLSGAKFNLALNSGSSALILAFKSLNIQKNDLVITQSYTFAATTNSIIQAGATPWLFDISKENFSLDLKKIEISINKNCSKKGKYYYHKKTNKRVFAICPVFVFSIVPNLARLGKIAKKYNLKIVFDAACALNSKFKNNCINKFSNVSIFSFNGNKTITTGSGGLLSTNDKKIYNRSRILAEQGKKNKKYEYHEIGYNLKMNNLSSSVGLAQIKRFNQIKKLKYSIKKKYDYFCKKNNLQILPSPKYSKHILWINCLILSTAKDTKKIIDLFKRNKIITNFFWKPLHMQKIKKNFLIEKDMNFTNYIWEKILPLPSSAGLIKKDQTKVLKTIKKYFNFI